MSSTVLVPVLDNNYPPKSRSAFISVLLHMLASSCLRLMFVFAYYLRFFENVRKLLSRSGTRALRDNNYPNKWRAPFLTRYFLSFFLLSFLPFPSVFSVCLSFSERNGKPKEGRECEGKGGKERRDKQKGEAKGKRGKDSKKGKDRTTEKQNRKEAKERKEKKDRREGDEREEGKERTRGRNGRGNRERRKGNQGRKEE